LAALRLEGGYGPDAYEELIAALIRRVAEYVHCLPATRAENHCEEGGLLRLAIESGCIAFRRADGKFLAGPAATDIENRERDRVWRYAILVGALLRPLGRCLTHMRAHARSHGELWNPLAEPLWSWLQRVDTGHLEFSWHSSSDTRATRAAAIWLASRLLDRSALKYLQSGGEGLHEQLLHVVSGEREGRLCEIVEHAYQAAIDQDFTQSGRDPEVARTDLRADHRVLEALRELAREKWTANAPGARLWFTQRGLYLLWRPAANDLLVRLRTAGLTHEPHDAPSLAAILIAHGVLVVRGEKGGEPLRRLVPHLRGLPRQALEVVELADAELLGWRTEGLECIEAEVSDPADPPGSIASPPLQLELTASPGSPGPSGPTDIAAPRQQSPTLESGPSAIEKVRAVEPGPALSIDAAAHPVDDEPNSARAPEVLENLDRLARFGQAGDALRKLGRHLLADPEACPVTSHPEGLAIGFPDALESIGVSPHEFVAACQAQGLLVPEHAGARNVLRQRRPHEPHLPEQYIVLVPRVARFLPHSG
jgi:conjugal transfer pilus assembly protein TraI